MYWLTVPSKRCTPSPRVEKKRSRIACHSCPALLQQVGLNLRRYRATELLEQEYKSRSAALNTIIEQMMLSDPEFRELMTEILGEMAGTRTEGLRTLDPSGATAQLRAVEFEDI